jgi:hypothetical protein
MTPLSMIGKKQIYLPGWKGADLAFFRGVNEWKAR